jgi:hypothetical protein
LSIGCLTGTTAGGVGGYQPDGTGPIPTLTPALKLGVPGLIETVRSVTSSRHAKLASCPAMPVALRHTNLVTEGHHKWSTKPFRKKQEAYLLEKEHLLKREFCSGLHEARGRGTLDLAEAGILSLPVKRSWAIELSMIEGVECLGAELQGRPGTPVCRHRTVGSRPWSTIATSGWLLRYRAQGLAERQSQDVQVPKQLASSGCNTIPGHFLVRWNVPARVTLIVRGSISRLFSHVYSKSPISLRPVALKTMPAPEILSIWSGGFRP